MPNPAATLITADEAAKLLGVHRTTLYDGARRGEIPCRRIGRRFVFVRETLLAWLRQDISTTTTNEVVVNTLASRLVCSKDTEVINTAVAAIQNGVPKRPSRRIAKKKSKRAKGRLTPRES